MVFPMVPHRMSANLLPVFHKLTLQYLLEINNNKLLINIYEKYIYCMIISLLLLQSKLVTHELNFKKIWINIWLNSQKVCHYRRNWCFTLLILTKNISIYRKRSTTLSTTLSYSALILLVKNTFFFLSIKHLLKNSIFEGIKVLIGNWELLLLIQKFLAFGFPESKPITTIIPGFLFRILHVWRSNFRKRKSI